MGNLLSSLKLPPGNPLDIKGSCRATGVDLDNACRLSFSGGMLRSIGDVNKGELTPDPGIAGQGIWLGVLPVFAVLLIGVVTTISHVIQRFSIFRRVINGRLFVFAGFVDLPNPDPGKLSSRFHAAVRAFVLAAADTQIIFVSAFVVSFVGRSKCQLTAYHYGVAVEMMTIGLSVVVFSVALVRTYWRNPLAALVRTVWTGAAFVGVHLALARTNNFAPDWPPASNPHENAVLLPVGCLLDSGLRKRATEQADAAGAHLGFHASALKWPQARIYLTALSVACVLAHASAPYRRLIQQRRVEGTTRAPWTSSRGHGWMVAGYWTTVLGIPAVGAPWAWYNVYMARKWARYSAWISTPNTEWILYDASQLIASMGVIILLLIAISTELWSTEKVRTKKGASSTSTSTAHTSSTGRRLPQYRPGVMMV